MIIKELFPFDSNESITRDADGNVICLPGSEKLFALHKESFIRGNKAHLKLLLENPGRHGANLNSFEQNGTLYSVLGYSGCRTLAEIIPDISDVTAEIDITLQMLRSLSAFHNAGMLHLDISSDNIMAELCGDGYEPKVMLIDYNSAYALEELSEHTGIYYSIKKSYTAPEVRLHRASQICAATDMFSAVSVFYELVCKTPLDWQALSEGNRAEVLKPLEGVSGLLPITAASLLRRIIKKGLSLSPDRRYQSCSELEYDLTELKKRIKGEGVSHSALFEISASAVKADSASAPETMLSTQAEFGGETLSPSELAVKMCGMSEKPMLLTGESGCGKTTLLKSIWRESCKRYEPSKPVVFYIPLNEYRGCGERFIYDYICRNITPDTEVRSIGHAYLALNGVLSGNDARTDVRGAKSALFLLDAFDEAGGDTRALVKEIKEIAAMPCASVVVSMRNSPTNFQVFSGSPRSTLLPLSDENVADYLFKNGVLAPSDSATKELLKSPLMLSLYVASEKLRAKNDFSQTALDGRDNIIDGYLTRLVSSLLASYSHDEDECCRINYAVSFLLPFLAGEMLKENGGSLTFSQVKKIAKENYRMLSEKSFCAAYTEYTGKSRTLLRDIKTPDEWFDYAVGELLIRRLKLLVKTDDGYSFAHICFAEHLMPKYTKIKSAISKQRVKRAVPRALCLFGAAALLAAAVWLLLLFGSANKYPSGDAEKEQLKSLLGTMSGRTATVSVSLVSQLKLLDEYEAALEAGDEMPSLRPLTDCVNTLNETRPAGNGEDMLSECGVKNRARLPFDAARYAAFYDFFAGEAKYEAEELGFIAEVLDNDSGYTDKRKLELIKQYKEYCRMCGLYIFYSCEEMIENVGDEYSKFFMDSAYINGSICAEALKSNIRLLGAEGKTNAEKADICYQYLKSNGRFS